MNTYIYVCMSVCMYVFMYVVWVGEYVCVYAAHSCSVYDYSKHILRLQQKIA